MNKSKYSLGIVVSVLIALSGCSVSNMVVKRVFDGKPSDTPNALLSEPDIEVARTVLPVAIKTLEAIHESVPNNPHVAIDAANAVLLMGVLVEHEAILSSLKNYSHSKATMERATRFYHRARNLATDGFQLWVQDFDTRILSHPDDVTAEIGHEQLAGLYALAGAWGLEIASNIRDSDRLVELPIVEKLLRRGLALDADYNKGAWHSFAFSYWTSRGDDDDTTARALMHYHEALRLSQGEDLSLKVAYANKIAIPAQDIDGFRHVLQEVIDAPAPTDRNRILMSQLAKEQARWMMRNIEEWFLLE